MMQTSVAPRPDLSALSLDAALQLDAMERSGSADLKIIQNFLDCLRSPSGLHADQNALNLNSNPLSADLFSTVIGRIDKHPVERVADLEKKVIALLTKLNAVAHGHDSENIGPLKKFCLSLHQALLNDAIPFREEDDWLIMKDERFA
jgi:hypothetical protein